MNHFNQGESSGGPLIQPAKRRRGRPRKDPSLKRSKSAHHPPPPGFEVRRETPNPHQTNGIDIMVGQPVTGVVEATFDAGYLLKVRIGNTDMNLRGVVFKPGHYVPVTAENDVAPHVQMIRRNDVNIPNENQGWSSRGQKHAVVPSKRRYNTSSSPKSAPSVHPVGVRGTVVPVVLQPVNLSNGTPNLSQIGGSNTPQIPSGHLMSFGDKDVHMVEPLSMLPPDRSIPASQIFVAPQPNSSHQVSVGNDKNDPAGLVNEFGVGEKGNPVKSTETDTVGSMETSELQIEGNDALNPFTEDSGVVSKQEIGVIAEPEPEPEPFLTESLQTDIIPKPLFNYGPGRMTALLQALQDNMKENKVQIAEQPTSASENEFHETIAAETDSNNESIVP